MSEFFFPQIWEDEFVHLFIASKTVSSGRRTERGRQGLSRGFTLILLAPVCRSTSETLFWLGSRPGVEWWLEGLLKELKLIPSAQIWATDLSKYLVPGSNYCEDVNVLPVSEACPYLFFKRSIVTMVKSHCCKQM